MAHFHGLCNNNCTLKCIDRILELRKLCLGSGRPIHCQKDKFYGTNNKNRLFEDYFDIKNPVNAHFQGLSHGNKLRKLEFMGLINHINFNKAIFRGLEALNHLLKAYFDI